jgi:hypothetical protein
MASIEKFAEELFAQKTFEEFGMEVDYQPFELDAKQLPMPTAMVDKKY